MGDVGLTCQRDGVETQLTCVGCGAPICPNCLVRTPIGLKCPECTGIGAKQARRSTPVIALVALVALPVLVWLALGATGSGSGSDDAARDLDVVDATTTARIGEEVRSGPFSFTVTSVDCVGPEVGTRPATRVAQGRFCLLYLTLRNAGERPELYSGPAQLVVDASAKRYNPGVMETGPPPPALVLDSGIREITTVRLNPGTELKGVLIFDMPAAARPAEFEFHHRPRTAGARVRLDTLAS